MRSLHYFHLVPLPRPVAGSVANTASQRSNQDQWLTVVSQMSMAQKNPSGAIRLGSRRANSLAAASSDAAVKTARRSNLKSGGQLRHSCDVCTNRKRTCDGDGVNRCR